MHVIHRSKLKRVEFTLAAGDIFDSGVDAIVNSEQTDFILSANPKSLSGQIWQRYGDSIQRELEAVTEGRVLGPGTVIDTSGGPDFKRIFHAGFHEPDDWLDSRTVEPMVAGSFVDPVREFQETNYFAAIGSCVAQILDNAVAQKVRSIAFPLIGCGRFGLDEKMLILQFLDAIEAFDDRLSEEESLHVWLVIRDRAQFESVAGTFLDLLMQARSKLISVRLRPSGVSILDRFANRLLERMNEDWAKWQLCRYAEVAIEIMCYAISRAALPTTTPEELVEEGRPASFGHFLGKARNLVNNSELDKTVWGVRFFSHLLKDAQSAHALEAINEQRNHLAHGRLSLPLSKIRKLLAQGLSLESWEQISATDGALQIAKWRPWVGESASEQVGLFERWQRNNLRYLVPETGEVFSIPRHEQPQ